MVLFFCLVFAVALPPGNFSADALDCWVLELYHAHHIRFTCYPVWVDNKKNVYFLCFDEWHFSVILSADFAVSL